MSPKRSSAEADLLPISTRRESSKRTKMSPSPSDSSATPSCSVSEDSALRSSPPASAETRQTSVSSVSGADDESESELSDSSLSESSSDSDDEDDDETVAGLEDDELEAYTREPPRRITDLSEPKRPTIDPQRLKEQQQVLLMRLREFMPKLMKANSELATKNAALNMEDVDEEEAHIEMDLGLGVLEEQREGDDSDTEDETKEVGKETTAMQELLGVQNEHSRPEIQELDVESTATSMRE